MGRFKQKKKFKQSQKRKEKRKRGKFVPFNLANSPRKYKGFKNKYFYKTNIHNLIYKDSYFNNVKYQTSNITKCNFRNAFLIGVEFYNSNLKDSDFRCSKLENVIFFNCNLKETNFKNATFNNVIFISTNINVAKNLVTLEGYRLINEYPRIQISNKLKNTILELSSNRDIYNSRVLHVRKNKLNLWNISLLYEEYGKDLVRALNALLNRKQKREFYTVYSYRIFIDNYLKR